MNTRYCHFQEVTPGMTSLVLLSITQPITATQLARRLDLTFQQCSDALKRLRAKQLVQCLNPYATRSRLYWLTDHGREHRRSSLSSPPIEEFSDADWRLYATVCFSHRSEVIRTLTAPMQPAQIKRRASFLRPGLRMSANNVRDVVRYLQRHGIVRQVRVKRRAHPRYVLTEAGRQFRQLLVQAEGAA